MISKSPNTEVKKILVNKKLFSIYKKDHLEIDDVLQVLNEETLPIDIHLNNNQIFIRDLTNYIIDNDITI